jgi:outer membrane protein assembly factor BamB
MISRIPALAAATAIWLLHPPGEIRGEGKGGWLHTELRRHAAPEAHQGVAVDGDHFYAITNRGIGKYRKSDGGRVGGWSGPPDGPVQHLNSGIVIGERLYVAHSNFPKQPTESSLEIWDTRSMAPVERHVFVDAPGSLTWIFPYDGGKTGGKGWLACFAHYRSHGDPADSRVVHFDEKWQAVGSWSFPPALIQRFAGSSSSGGAIGPEGHLFVTGHDAKELYLVELPASPEGELRWVDTLAISAEGQAFAWDPDGSGTLYSISRSRREVIVSRISRQP